LQDEPKPSVSQTPQPVGLTLEPPPARGWFSKSVIVCLLLLALGWFGLQPNVEKWIGPSAHAISIAVRRVLVPTFAAVQTDPASTAVPNDSSTSPKSEGSSDGKAMRVPQQGSVESSSSDGGHN
jgi:hypothetical protein